MFPNILHIASSYYLLPTTAAAAAAVATHTGKERERERLGKIEKGGGRTRSRFGSIGSTGGIGGGQKNTHKKKRRKERKKQKRNYALVWESSRLGWEGCYGTF